MPFAPGMARPSAAEALRQTVPTSAPRHEHRTAKVIELVGSSTKSFDDAVRNALHDASETTRGITGAHVLNMSVKCIEGDIVEYKVDLKVAFGVERTPGL